MSEHRIGSRQEWRSELTELLRLEKEHTRRGDELARRRRELPWVRIEKQYALETREGPRTLAQLFDGRSQLVVYHFMFGPQYDAGCPTCSSTADAFNGILSHLAACDVTMICVSRAPIAKLESYRERMGWSFTWASSFESDFNADYGVSLGERADDEAPHANEMDLLGMLQAQPEIREQLPRIAFENARATGTDLEGYFSDGHGVSTFVRDGDEVYHCYSSYARGSEFLMGYYAILDRAPRGRGEEEGPMGWLRRHDEYEYATR